MRSVSARRGKIAELLSKKRDEPDQPTGRLTRRRGNEGRPAPQIAGRPAVMVFSEGPAVLGDCL
jgi:hypothetical protein